MNSRLFILSGIMMTQSMHAITLHNLRIALEKQKPSLFDYDLGIVIVPSTQSNAPVTICCHGYGANNRIVKSVHSYGAINHHLVGFNFPDYDLGTRPYAPERSAFGTIHELLPLLYVLKLAVIDGNLSTVNLYGFSAGAAAIINALGTLNRSMYDKELREIGIGNVQKNLIVEAITRGIVILECPLKSIEELMSLRGKQPEFEILAQRYAHNDMRPIDAVKHLQGLALQIVLYFHQPDEIIGNRDDALFIDRLKQNNKGVTHAVVGKGQGGHNTFHPLLWQEYKKIRKR